MEFPIFGSFFFRIPPPNSHREPLRLTVADTFAQ